MLSGVSLANLFHTGVEPSLGLREAIFGRDDKVSSIFFRAGGRFNRDKQFSSVSFLSHRQAFNEAQLFGVSLVVRRDGKGSLQVTDIGNRKAPEVVSVGVVHAEEAIVEVVSHRSICRGRDKEYRLGNQVTLRLKEFDHEFAD